MGVVDDVASGAEERIADALGSSPQRDNFNIWREIEKNAVSALGIGD